MIRIVRRGDAVAISADLPAGALAYLDREWLLGEPDAPVPALVVGPTRVMSWSRRPPVPWDGVDPDAAALAALAAVAHEAVRAGGEGGDDRCLEVQGEGVLAQLVRQISPGLAHRAASASSRFHLLSKWRPAAASVAPALVVDTTGCPAAIVGATRRLADLGTLVLAGQPLGRALSMSLYPDVHRRGLRLVGVPPPLSAAPPAPAAELALAGLPPPARVVPGQQVPPAPWYRLAVS